MGKLLKEIMMPEATTVVQSHGCCTMATYCWEIPASATYQLPGIAFAHLHIVIGVIGVIIATLEGGGRGREGNGEGEKGRGTVDGLAKTPHIHSLQC
jgi:hypothetical protein